MMLFVFLQPRKVYAQAEMCSTGSSYPNALTVVGAPPCNDPITAPFYLRIAVNLIRRSDGSCDRTLQDVYEALLKNTFQPHNAAQAAVQRFRAAVQVEGNNNPNVQIDCNTFSAFSDFDLRIFDSPDFKDQGGCDPIEPEINPPTANLWHDAATAPAGTYHIYYANPTQNFSVTYQPGNEPTLVSDNVETFDCNDDYNDCNSFIFEGGEIADRIAYLQNRMYQSATQEEYERFYAELMRTYLQNSMLPQAKAETETRNDTEGDKTLIATYTDERNLEKADSLLQTLPQETPEDIAFYNFFSAYLYELLNNADHMPFEGKALSSTAFQIQSMAANDNATSHISLFAQAATATQQNNQYHRTPVDFKTNSTADIVTKDVLQIVPNPARNEAFISLQTNDWQQISSLKVYSLTGKLLQTLPLNRQPVYKPILLNTQNLANGLYICKITTQSDKIVTSKLLISR